jgi:hypothetical protein
MSNEAFMAERYKNGESITFVYLASNDKNKGKIYADQGNCSPEVARPTGLREELANFRAS